MRRAPTLVLMLALGACAGGDEVTPVPFDDSLRPEMPYDPMSPPARRDPTPVEETPPGPHASQIPATLAPVAAARIVVVGDTTSAGGGAAEDDTYFGLLSENDDDLWPDASALDLETMMGQVPDVVRSAVYNGNAATMESRQLPLLSMSTYLGDVVVGHSVVVITIGIHDVISEVQSGDSTPRIEALEHIRAVVRYFRDPVRFPDGTSIYLVNVIDPTNGTGLSDGCFSSREVPAMPAAIDAINAQYLALGSELGIGVIDAHGYFMGHGFAGRIGEYGAGSTSANSWFESCIVPDERGHNELRKLLFEAIDGTYVAS